MPSLFDYVKEVQGYVRDREQRMLNINDIIRYINRSRREIAMRAQCIRKIPPISGPIVSIDVTAFGSGYTNPTVIITPPDMPGGQLLNPGGLQAMASAIVIGGQIASISVTNGGDGYFQPFVSVSDPTGSGAIATATTVPLSQMVANQEEYFLRDINVSSFPGVKSVYALFSNFIIYNNLRYRLNHYDLTTYKSMIEQYPHQYYYVPVACAQKEQGAGGSYLFYPIPSQTYAWEPDCLCLPIDLKSDGDYEAIPEPWTDAVAFLAASYAFAELQSYNNSRFWKDQFNEFVLRYSTAARPRMLISVYGRG